MCNGFLGVPIGLYLGVDLCNIMFYYEWSVRPAEFQFPFLRNYPKMYSIAMQHLQSLTEKILTRTFF